MTTFTVVMVLKLWVGVEFMLTPVSSFTSLTAPENISSD